MINKIILGDCLTVLPKLLPQFDLVYIDPPFGTNKTQKLTRIKTTKSLVGDRVGFGGNTYSTEKVSELSYADNFDDYIAFLEPRVKAIYSSMKSSGSFFLHLDYRNVHYAKVMCDKIFGRENFINEIVWLYDYGAKSKKKWSAKHDNILWYAKNNKNYIFNFDQVDRVPYMAPKLAGKEKAARGKALCDWWFNTIVPTNSRERTGYPTQKPLKILDRIIRVHSKPEDLVLDAFAGSGSFGEAAAKNNRNFILIDSNKAAIEIMEKRLGINYSFSTLTEADL